MSNLRSSDVLPGAGAPGGTPGTGGGLSEAEVRTLVDNLDLVKDRGDWSSSSDYQPRDFVRNDGAFYLNISRAAPGTDAVTEPGTGTGWESHWHRVGFEDGPPNAFVNAVINGQTLTFQRESGQNAVEIDIPSGDGGAVAPSTIAAFNPALISDRTYTWDGGTTQIIDILSGTAGTAQLVSPDSGFLIISIHGFSDFEGNSTWRLSEDLRAATQSEPLHIRPTGSQGFTPADLYTNSDNEVSIKLGQAVSEVPPINRITIWHVPDPADDFIDHGLARVEQIRFDAITLARPDIEATPISTNPITVLAGAGVSSILSGVSGNDFTVSAGVYVVFLDDTLTTGGRDSSPRFSLRNAADDSVLFSSTSPSLPVAGSFRSGLMTVALFTSDTEINVLFERQNKQVSLPANWALDFIRVSGILPPATRPTIVRFDVTGEASPPVGSIAGQVYSYDISISQPAHVSAARIVGFAGSGRSPSNVAVLATLSEYHSSSGQFSVPAGISLTAGQVYTLRLEVYEIGQTVGTDFPSAYHDYRITAHATDNATHFGRVLSSENASSIVFADDDISTAGTVVRTWVARVPDDSNEYRLYWAVPASETQPTDWTTSGVSIASAIDAAVDRTISGVAYKIYMFSTSAVVDHSYDGTSIVVT